MTRGVGISAGMAWMPWFPRDFRSSTLVWPFVARAVYRELLDFSWDAGGLPADSADLRELLRISDAEWARAWPYVEPKFPVGEDGLRRNPRQEQHRAQSLDRKAKNGERASKAAHARWGKDAPSNALSTAQSNALSNSQSMPSTSTSTSTSSSTSSSTSTSTSTSTSVTELSERVPRARRATRLPEDFELTAERRQVAEAEGLHSERVFAKFCDHWRSASGKNARKLDWDAAWRKWCLNESDFRGSRGADPEALAQRRTQDAKAVALRREMDRAKAIGCQLQPYDVDSADSFATRVRDWEREHKSSERPPPRFPVARQVAR